MVTLAKKQRTDSVVRPWLLIGAASGVLVWVQVLLGLVIDPELSGLSRWMGTSAGLAAGFVLGIGLWRRSAPALLFFFPALLLTPVLAMSDASRDSLFSQVRWLVWLSGFAVYLVAACLRCGERDANNAFESRPVDGVPSQLAPLASIRGVVGLAALVGPLVILVQASSREHFSAQVHAEVVFNHLLILFAWVIAFYTFFLAPLINRSADRIDWERRRFYAAQGKGRSRQLALRAIWVAVLGLLVAILWTTPVGS